MIRAVDLFCGVGGLTNGLERAGIDVRLGIDVDPTCEYPYTANNVATFRLMSVEAVTATDLNAVFDGAEFKLLAGVRPVPTVFDLQPKAVSRIPSTVESTGPFLPISW